MPITRTWTINPATGRQEVSCSGEYGGGGSGGPDPDYRTPGTATSAATMTVDVDTYDVYSHTAQAEALTIAAPTGTPVDGQRLTIRIKDDGTARALTWNSAFAAVGVTLPTTTVISKKHYISCRWNANASKWDVLAVSAEA